MTLAVEDLGIRYGERTALVPTSLDFRPGELVALIGPNGAGKSSLLQALAGVVPCSGRIVWSGTDVGAFEPRERARTLAYLPQNPVAHWPLSVREVVALGRLPHRRLGETQREADRCAVESALDTLGLSPFAERSVATLSGGERARALLARAIAVDAPVLLVDEPVASLDPYHQLQVMTLVRAYAARDGGRSSLVIAALHDLSLAARFCARVILLHGGAVVGDGRPGDVLSPAALAKFYRVTAYVGAHGGEPVIVPWQMRE